LNQQPELFVSPVLDLRHAGAVSGGASSSSSSSAQRSAPWLARCLLVSGALALSACSTIQPTPLDGAALQQQAQADAATAQQDVAPIQGALGLDEAIARALKYNLDRRTRMMEEALALGQLQAGQYDMLPKLIAAAGYTERSEYATTRAVDSVTGTPSLSNPYISSDKRHAIGNLGLTWNLLDFGLSYHTAQQNADRVLIAAERRRKAMHVLVQDVTTAFWRTASAQKLRADVAATSRLAEAALADARQAEQERLRSPLESLRYQRQVLENLRLLEAIEHELSTAKLELAVLINAPTGADWQVAEPDDALGRKLLEQPVEELEAQALAQNAELREQHYNARIAAVETKKVILRLFPSLSFHYDLRYDSDKYLVNSRWNEAGAQFSFNLLNLLSAPAHMRLAEAGVALADQRRVATRMAVLAQLHVARLQYAGALQQYERAAAIAQVDARIDAQIASRAAVQMQSGLDSVAHRTAALLSRLRQYQALAAAHAAGGKFLATLGMEPQLDSVQALSLAQLQSGIADTRRRWNAGELPVTTVRTSAPTAQP
jgi:outer membrane protein TolC